MGAREVVWLFRPLTAGLVERLVDADMVKV